MFARFRHSLSWQTLPAILLGVYAGAIAHQLEPSAAVAALRAACGVLADGFLLGANLLALPMVVAAAMDGVVGLEGTRGLRRLGWKTLACLVGASFLVLLLGVLLEATHLFQCFAGQRLYQSSVRLELYLSPPAPVPLSALDHPAALFSAPFWFAVTILSLGFGLYRNRIGEGRAHLLLRFWRGVDEVSRHTAGWSRKVVPIGLFALVFAAFGESGLRSTEDGSLAGMLVCTVVCWGIYSVVVLPLMLWRFARINPWAYARIWWPAVATALCSGAVTAALPLAIDGLRRRTGISKRVGCVVLPLDASVQRDGVVLGWIALAFYFATHNGGFLGMAELAGTGLFIWAMSIAGVPLGGLGWSGLVLGRHTDSATLGGNTVFLILWIACGGAAVSQWSVACVAAVVAHWEGETDLLTPRLPDDPFLGERLSKHFV